MKHNLDQWAELLAAKKGSIVDFMKDVKEQRWRASGLIVEHVLPVVSTTSFGASTDEVIELVIIASLDMGHEDEAEALVTSLEKKWKESKRVKRLRGLLAEAKGDFNAAKSIYESLISEDETDSRVWKRRIAIARGSGKLNDAVDLLNEYLAIFATDSSAWGELASCYTELGASDGALWALEEQLLLAPKNHLIHTRYADLVSISGDVDDLLTARKYYSYALELNPDGSNTRALYGLLMTTHALKKAGKTDETNLALFNLASDALDASYTKSSASKPKETLLGFLADLKKDIEKKK